MSPCVCNTNTRCRAHKAAQLAHSKPRAKQKPDGKKRGPKPGQSKWRDYAILRLSDGLYYRGVNQRHVPEWTPDLAAATTYHGIRAARLIVGALEARREPVRSCRSARTHWRIVDPADLSWEAYWPW